MTTRHVLTDDRTPAITDCGNVLVGLKHEKIQSGANDKRHRAVNPYSMHDVLEIDGLLEWTYPGTPGVYHTGSFNGCFGGVSVPSTAIDSNSNLKLINRLGEKIKQHDFNAAVSVGAEGKEALEQVAAKTGEIYRGMKALKKGNVQLALREFGLSPKQAKRVGYHKDLSDRVLATQLGWIPLMSDIKSAAEAYHAMSVTPKSQTYVASVRRSANVTALGGVVVGSTFTSRKIHWTLSEELSWQESLGLSNPWDFADALWNATTLSFIADWFIPIGAYLEARSLATVLKGSGYYTDFTKTQARFSGGSLGVYTVKNCGYVFSETRVERVLLSSLSGLTALPTWKPLTSVPSLRRALTSVALATQMFI